jgi:hypothetical protein
MAIAETSYCVHAKMRPMGAHMRERRRALGANGETQTSRDVIAGELALALGELDSPPTPNATSSRTERACANYGMLPDVTRQQVRRLALRDVIAPCAAVLLRGAPAHHESSAAPTVTA